MKKTSFDANLDVITSRQKEMENKFQKFSKEPVGSSLQQQKEELLEIVQDNCMMIGYLFIFEDKDYTEEIRQLVIKNREVARKLNSILVEIDLIGKE